MAKKFIQRQLLKNSKLFGEVRDCQFSIRYKLLKLIES